jgi:hypothetical protein
MKMIFLTTTNNTVNLYIQILTLYGISNLKEFISYMSVWNVSDNILEYEDTRYYGFEIDLEYVDFLNNFLVSKGFENVTLKYLQDNLDNPKK